MRPYATAELNFEPPPKLSWRAERRLSGRAVAVWEACCCDGEPPAAADFEHGELALFCAKSSVGLAATADGVSVASVGARVAAVFGLARGRLVGGAPPLGVRLIRAFAEVCEARAPVSFEASLTAGASGAVMLTRGVLLPLLDDAGALTQALAIMTWKEVLGATASDRLRGELGGAVAAGRAAQPGRGAPLPNSLYATFASAPPASGDRAVTTWPMRTIASIGARHLVTAPLPTHKRGQRTTGS